MSVVWKNIYGIFFHTADLCLRLKVCRLRKGMVIIMKKTWMNAEVEELSLEMTQNGMLPDDDFDGPWQQLSDGRWWRPGNGSTSTN